MIGQAVTDSFILWLLLVIIAILVIVYLIRRL